jgi:hypothetical protein
MANRQLRILSNCNFRFELASLWSFGCEIMTGTLSRSGRHTISIQSTPSPTFQSNLESHDRPDTGLNDGRSAIIWLEARPSLNRDCPKAWVPPSTTGPESRSARGQPLLKPTRPDHESAALIIWWNTKRFWRLLRAPQCFTRMMEEKEYHTMSNLDV